MFGHIYKECDICGGDGKVPAPNGQTGSINCPWCLGGRSGPWGDIDFIGEEIASMQVKLDSIKAMLDSTVFGMQKMSSNLDDIMVKLDV